MSAKPKLKAVPQIPQAPSCHHCRANAALGDETERSALELHRLEVAILDLELCRNESDDVRHAIANRARESLRDVQQALVMIQSAITVTKTKKKGGRPRMPKTVAGAFVAAFDDLREIALGDPPANKKTAPPTEEPRD